MAIVCPLPGGPRASTLDDYDVSVIEEHAEAVRRYCQTHTRTTADAEDAFQQTFLGFLERRQTELDDPGSWLIAVASRACAGVYRRRTRSERLACSMAPTRSPDPADFLVGRAFTEELLGRLEPRDRQVLASVYLAGFSSEEVARRLNVSPGSFRLIALRARRRARRIGDAMGGALSTLTWPGLLSRLRESLRQRLRRHAQGLHQHGDALAHLPCDNLTILVAIGLLPLAASMAIAPAGGDASAVAPPGRIDRALAGAVGPGSGGLAATTSPGSGSRDPRRADAGPVPGVTFATPAGAASGAPPSGLDGVAPGRGEAGSRGGGWPVGQPTGIIPPGGGGGGQATAGILPPADPGPGSASFFSLSPAPDGSVYASGVVMPCVEPCSVVFRSAHSGQPWHHLDSLGYLGGHIIAPPGEPGGRVLFAAGPHGLQRSGDGGHLFQTVVPELSSSSASADPSSPPGDARITIGALPLVDYHEASGLVTPGPALPPGLRSVTDIAYTATGDLLVAGIALDPEARGEAATVVALCPAATPTCSVVDVLPVAAPLRLSVPPWPADTHLVLMFGRNLLYESTDDGRHFAGGPLADVNSIQGAAPTDDYTSTGTLLVSGQPVKAERPVLLRGSLGMLGPISTRGLPEIGPVRELLSLPGTILAALSFADESRLFGILNSSDGGYTWSR